MYFHKKHSNIDFEVFDDNGEFVVEPNNASKKFLKDSGTSITELLKNGQFNKHKAAVIPKKKKPKIQSDDDLADDVGNEAVNSDDIQPVRVESDLEEGMN